MTSKSLRDSIKELEDPGLSVNFADSDDDLTFAKVADGGVEEEEQEVDQEADNGKNKFRNLRRKNLVEEDEEWGKKYSGNKISRKNLKKWESDEESISDNEDEEEEETLTSDDEVVDDKRDNQDDVESDAEESEYEDEDDEGSDGMMNVDFSKLPKDLIGTVVAANNNIDEELEEDDEDDVETFKNANQAEDKIKGEVTRLQLEYMDKLLESRIRLQKSMQICNTMPQNEQMKNFLREGGPQIQESYKQAKGTLTTLLNNLLKLQEELYNTNEETENLLTEGSLDDTEKPKNDVDDDEEIPSDTDDEENEKVPDKQKEDTDEKTGGQNKLNLPSKRKSTLTLDDFEEEMGKRYKVFCGYRNTTILKWYDKTRLMTGKANKGFSAFETSTLQQIKQVLSDKERLLKRSQLKRTQYKILGKEEEESKETEEVDAHLKNHDAEIFDDSDFYHEMLKELIERKSNLSNNGEGDDPIASGRRWLQLQKLRTKTKRKVDTRASKGRKVRYNVHSKLVSFMAPQDIGTMNDQARNDLFSSLFGGIVTAER